MAEIQVELVNEGHPVEYKGKRSWGHARTIKVDRVWHVLYDGEVIGSIVYRMFTREQRTPGKMYVNSRWQSPGWGYRSGEARSAYDFHRPLEAFTKKDAVESIVRDHERNTKTPNKES